MIEEISDMYLEMSESADKMHEKMCELKGICEEKDLGPELDEVWSYVASIRSALIDMEFPLMDLENALGGGEE